MYIAWACFRNAYMLHLIHTLGAVFSLEHIVVMTSKGITLSNKNRIVSKEIARRRILHFGFYYLIH